METKPETELVVPEKKVYSMEVEYTFQADKDSEVQTSWYYHWVVNDNLKRAITAAKKHFTEMVKETGWTSKVKIISIHEMQNDKSRAEVLTVSTTELPPTRTRKTTGTARKSPTAKTTTKPATKPRAKSTTPRKPRTTKPKSLPL